LQKIALDTRSSATTRLHGFDFFNYDIRGLSNGTIRNVDTFFAYSNATNLISSSAGTVETVRVVSLGNNTDSKGLINLNKTSATSTDFVRALYNLTSTSSTTAANTKVGVVFRFDGVNGTMNAAPIVADFFSFGYLNDGITKGDRVNNMIVRIEAEETGDNTSIFDGTLEFITLNQLNILNGNLYGNLTTIGDDPQFIVHQDLDDEEAPRVNYNDLAGDGTVTQVSDQEDAPTHSGVVSFDKPTYKQADTVTVTLED